MVEEVIKQETKKMLEAKDYKLKNYFDKYENADHAPLAQLDRATAF